MLLLFKLFVSFSVLDFHPNQVSGFQFVILKILLVIFGSLYCKRSSYIYGTCNPHVC